MQSEAQFKSKEISKRGVVDDMVDANPILYAPGEHPDHVIGTIFNILFPLFLSSPQASLFFRQ